ncbi:MAG: glycerol-3-phosphate dehydrogenase subunit GlpB [Phocaeicola sp.]
MKFDSIIIGGGLSGLTCAISLAVRGQKCAIISSGQSALHFSGGSFDLLGRVKGQDVLDPFEKMNDLSPNHPYKLLGLDRVKQLVEQVKPLFERCGVTLRGSNTNHYRVTPIGVLRPTWLSLEDFNVIESKESIGWKKIVVLNISGYLDFHTKFIADELEKYGVESKIGSVSTPELDRLRESPTEMRSANIAQTLENREVLAKLAREVNRQLDKDTEAVVLPAVFGLSNTGVIEALREMVVKPIWLIPTMPISVPGVRTQMKMRNYFQRLGGVFMLGDTVLSGEIENGKVLSIKTANHGDIKIKADNFVLGSGSFFSHGLVSTPNQILEPIFNLDTISGKTREEWYDKNIFNDQPYMSYGAKVGSDFKGVIDGEKIDNLYVIGSLIGGYNPLKEACGAGVSILTAMNVADSITKKTE